MIFPYKWKVEALYHIYYGTWIVSGVFEVRRKKWIISNLQDDKEDRDEINEALFKFWRKMGAM